MTHSVFFNFDRIHKVKLSLLLVMLVTVSLYSQQHKQEDRVNHYHLSAFAGFTTNYKGKQGYKLGIEYEYRLTDVIGLGGTFDFTGNDFNIFAFSVGADFYLFDFSLIPAIGVGAKSYDSKWDPFLRTMLAYDFHLNSISIGPMVMYDLFPKQKNIMSYGVSLGISLH